MKTIFNVTDSANSLSIKPFKYAKLLVTKILSCGDGDKKCILNIMFLKGSDALICHSAHRYWKGKMKAVPRDPAFESASLLKLPDYGVKYKNASLNATESKFQREIS